MKTIVRPADAVAAYLESYVPDGRRFDELLDDHGAVRPHWQPLLERLTAADMRERIRRAPELTRRLIVENGVTYTAHGDPRGIERPWTLDAVPFVLSLKEWRLIERGVAQRAHLLDLVLADLYGPQQLLAEGVIPPELPFGHPNFLWPCHGIRPHDGVWLHLYAADLARGPDGRWWILADRTQAPSGAGYALENRDILEQLLPESIRDLAVQGLRGFFAELRERLLSHVEPGASPVGVVLTPGPVDETYFEHAYLARQLGWPLVEGADLTVRDDTVYLKTIAGLRRVHAILRRIEDGECDPLELKSGSALGVPGLIGALRARRIVLANMLGTGVLESAAWLAFLPGAADRLLGEPLALPAVATWWCGEWPALDFVRKNLDRLVIQPTYPNQRFEPVLGATVTGRARTALIERLEGRPYGYLAREPLLSSQGPALRPGRASGFAAKALAIRVYALATPAGRIVMPGGIARIAESSDAGSRPGTGGSKDLWILPERSAGQAPAPPPASMQLPSRPDDLPIASARLPIRQDDLPSRLVENLYWLGRYGARCEDKARLLRATLTGRIESGVFESAVKFCREAGVIGADIDPWGALRSSHPHGLAFDVGQLAQCAAQVRGRLSGGCWRAVVQLQRQLQPAVLAREDVRESLDRLLLSLAALGGFVLDDMTQDAGGCFLRIGRRLERLPFLAQLLARHVGGTNATRRSHIEWLLEACESLRAYRLRYAAAPRLAAALDLLIQDATHPRALACQWQLLMGDLGALAAAVGGSERSAGERLTEQPPMLSEQALLALEADGASQDAARAALADRLRALGTAAAQLSDRLSMRHFSHSQLGLHSVAS
jgi:uncharacterized circularly permuted ATP-grasp superfamily protein/uncharacterized alpha-E superfamily protein